jgi:antirestriction protein ArdC
MTEKSKHEQDAAQRQAELLTEALEKARSNDSQFLNQSGKRAPELYPKGVTVSPFNSLILALHSDSKEFKTNDYVLFSEAKKRGDSVQGGEKGVPFVWYNWNQYANKEKPEDIISKDDYKALPDDAKDSYKAVRQREIRTLFNVDQTTMAMSNPEEYGRLIDMSKEQDEKKIHMEVNRFLQNMKDNLVNVRKDGTGVPHYDTAKDTIFLPAQKHFASYAEYVQDALRQIVSATGHPQRLNRNGFVMDGGTVPKESQQSREKLVIEMASAVKMTQFGLPARLSKDAMQEIGNWEKELKDNPRFLDALEMDINNSLGMIAKAERGEKIELGPQKETDETQNESVNARVIMLQDSESKRWILYIKPENEKALTVYPEKDDVGRFFAAAKHSEEKADRVRQELAQKYYGLAMAKPDINTDIFGKAPEGVDLDAIQRVNIFKSKNDGKILCLVSIDGMDKLPPREVSPFQWQKMWLAEDKNEYKRILAANLFEDQLRSRKEAVQQEHAKEQEEEKRQNSPEQKAKEEREEKAKEELTKAETKAVAAIALTPILRQYDDLKKKHPDALLLFRTGDFYQTYRDDARKASSILGITLTRNSQIKDREGKPLETAGFPQHALDTYLPKLIRAGERVAICDQIESSQRQQQQEKQNVVPEQEKEATRGYHR